MTEPRPERPSRAVSIVRFTMTWLERMWWKLLIVAALILAYTIGAPKDFKILDWIKEAFNK